MAEFSTIDSLTVPDLAERFNTTPSRIRQMLDTQQLAAVRIDGVLRIPEAFIVGQDALPALQGTLVVLRDAGFDNDEAVAWLLDYNDDLGMSPIESLRAGSKAAVRRVAQSLAF